MNQNRIFKNILFSVAYWIGVSILFVVTRYGAIGIDFDLINNEGLVPDDFISAFVFGSLMGIILGYFESYETFLFTKRQSFGFILVTKTLIYIFFFSLTSFIQVSLEEGSVSGGLNFLVSKLAFVALLNFFVYSFLFHYVRLMNKSMGPGILFEYLIGRYFNPREEDRIFLFIDLKSSTTIAEKIGHRIYSSLIQECFRVLTLPLIRFKGHVYQYVGDEVVITWKMKDGINNLNCIQFFFSFLYGLEAKRKYFINKYGIFPEFKAGLSSGKVTVAEVGELKSEISFHGDVLNTASRLQALCHDYNAVMLISEAVFMQIGEPERKSGYTFYFTGERQLKGKRKAVKIYAVRKRNGEDPT